jgi:hypothetical protein
MKLVVPRDTKAGTKQYYLDELKGEGEAGGS